MGEERKLEWACHQIARLLAQVAQFEERVKQLEDAHGVYAHTHGPTEGELLAALGPCGR